MSVEKTIAAVIHIFFSLTVEGQDAVDMGGRVGLTPPNTHSETP